MSKFVISISVEFNLFCFNYKSEPNHLMIKSLVSLTIKFSNNKILRFKVNLDLLLTRFM